MRVDTKNVIYTFSSKVHPVATVPQNREVTIETLDCYGNEITEEYSGDVRPLKGGINPVTGPIFIEGAEVGDTLVVEIVDIGLEETGTMRLRPEQGAFGRILSETSVKKINIVDRCVQITDQLQIPIRPMIGCIGVAPKSGEVGTINPGNHGGNLDTKLIEPGTTVYLPINVKGALFGLGDLHAVMGDGESAVCGLEIAGEVTVRFTVIKDIQANWPVIETANAWSLLASHELLDEAVIEASEQMLQFLQERAPLPTNDWVRILGLGADLEVSQIVNPIKTARMTVPKMVTDAFNISF